MNDIYHSGEREIQRKVGEERMATSNGRMISDQLFAGAINFIEKQPMAIVSSADAGGQIWASLLIGDFGFIKVLDPTSLVFDETMIRSSMDDVFYQNIKANSEIGSLFIELESRKRFRVNGISSKNGSKIKININEAYPNCPKYIQRRVISSPDHFKEINSKTIVGTQLAQPEKDWIQNADTLFIGSSSNHGNMDASHRGGNPGFVEVLDDGTLKIPDYQGNSMYNTLGNFVQNSNAGILFINFESRETMQLTGKATLLFDQKLHHHLQKIAGTGRYWLFKTEQWIRTENHHRVDWQLLDYSRFNP